VKREDRIEEGDIVTVVYGASGDFLLKDYIVLGIPADTGDAWKLKAPSGKVVYVQTYLSIDLEKKKEEALAKPQQGETP
jgi:hypothetical protein